MNYLDKLAKNINCRQRKQKINSNKSFAVLALLTVTIGGAVAAFFTHSCREEKRNITIRNVKDIDEDINIKRDEIKQTLEKEGDESVGDVGVAMEKALDDLKEI